MKALILGTKQYAAPFEAHYDCVCCANPELNTIGQYDLVVFCGGTDVDPQLYKEKKSQWVHTTDLDRDNRERSIFDAAFDAAIPMVGICRGSQFLTVMNGGKLVQHIEGHAIAGTHKVEYILPDKIIRQAEITSTHHQMMYPYSSPNTYLIVGYAQDRVKTYISALPSSHNLETSINIEESSTVEMVWWPVSGCLCIQGHPEYMQHNSSGWKMMQELLSGYIL